MGWDTHRFGDWYATDAASGRIPYRFQWEYPTPTPEFRAHVAAHLREETFAGVAYEPSTHTLTIGWFGVDDLRAAINEALLAIRPLVRWYVTADGRETPLSTVVRDVVASERYEVVVDGRAGTAIDFTITCDPGWQDDETLASPEAQPSSVPGVFQFRGLRGSMPAPFRLAVTNDQATGAQTLGFRHAPDAAVAYTQDYQGAADADALSGEAATATMDADGVAIGTPATLDTAAMRGWWLAVARLEQPDATPGDTTYWAEASTSGSGIALSETFSTDAVEATETDSYEHMRLGPLPIPAGPVPSIATGSGYGTEAERITQTTDSGTATLNYADTPVSIGQRWTANWNGQLTAVEYVIDAEPTAGRTWYLDIGYSPYGFQVLLQRVELDSSDLTVGTHKITLPSPVSVTAGIDYYHQLYSPVSGVYGSIGLAYGAADPYADGYAYATNATGLPSNCDFVFKLYGTAALGFDSQVGIQAANAGAGTVKLDTVALIPYDEFAVLADVPASTLTAGRGLLIDAMEAERVVVYITDTWQNSAPVDQALVDWLGSPVIWPGDTDVVYDAETPGDAAPQGCDATLAYRPTYQTPYGA